MFALIPLLSSPYLARLTLSVPDRADRRWWRGRTASWQRTLATAAVAALLGSLVRDWSFAWLAACATPLVVIDVEHHRLPDRLVLPVAAGGLLLGPWPRSVLAGAVALVVLLLVALAGRFGLGDVKLGAALALYLGRHALSGLALGFVLGGVAALVLLMLRRAGRATAIAFGPWLVLGAFLAPWLA